MLIYLGIHSINIYTYDFTFYLKSGISVEWRLDEWFSFNVIPLILFLFLACDWYKKSQAANLKTENF